MGEEKRIKDLAAASSITNNDYLAMDNANNSAAKKTSAMPLKNVQASSDVYSSSKAYNVGDLVIQYNQLYRCHTACSAASWSTNSGYFDAVTLTDAVTQLNNDLNTKMSKTSDVINTGYSGYTAHKNGDLVVLNVKGGYSDSYALPATIRPPYEISGPCLYYDTTWRLGWMTIGTGGKIVVRQNNSSSVVSPNPTNISFNVSYIV